jgi:integrase
LAASLGCPSLSCVSTACRKIIQAFLLVALKVHPKVAQRFLRHSQIAMTMEVYADASEEEVRAALGKLSAAMGGAGADTG